jgi:hypothetical protein
MKKKIQDRVQMVVNCKVPLGVVDHAETPLLLGHGNEDCLVPLTQGTLVFGRYGCQEKELMVFPGQHNSMRPRQWYESGGRFVYRYLGVRAAVRDYDEVDASSVIHVGESDAVICELYHQQAGGSPRGVLMRTLRRPREMVAR